MPRNVLFEPVPRVAPTGPPDAYQRVPVSADAFGASQAKALGQFGEALGKASETIHDANIKNAEIDSDVYMAENNTWFANRLTERHEKFGVLQGRAAMDDLPQYKEDIEKLFQESVAQARSPRERAMLAKAGRPLTQRYFGYATQHANSQSRVYADRTATNRAATFGAQAMVAQQQGDDVGMEVALGVSDDEVRKIYEQKRFDKEVTDYEVRKNRGNNLRTIIENVATNDPEQGLALFSKYRSQMDPANEGAVATKLRGPMTEIAGRQLGEEALGQKQFPSNINQEVKLSAEIAGVDPAMLQALIRIESGGNPGAVKGRYKGLGQLSDDLFQQHGGGDIFNPRDNLRATAKKLASDVSEFRSKYGKEPTAGDIYLMHQQGAGGYAAHMANPDKPAWQNMASTAEGRQKGEAWAKAAIWGNVPDKDKARFGSVDNLTSAQFTSLWRGKVDSAMGKSLPDQGEAYSNAREILQQRKASPALETATMSYIARRYSRMETETTVERNTVKALVESDLSSLLQTGQGANDISPERVRSSLGEVAAREWEAKRNDNLAVWNTTNDMYALTDAQIDDRLGAIVPKGGEADYTRKLGVYETSQKRADELRKTRNEDPATSVKASPMVKEASVASRSGTPASMQALMTARLAAQSLAGIDEDSQSPITREEAQKLTVPLRRMLPGQERETLTTLAQEFKEMFGEHADKAFQYALRVNRLETATAQTAARIMKKLSLGQLPTDTEAAAVDRQSEIDAANKTMRPLGPTFASPGAVQGGSLSDMGQFSSPIEDSPASKETTTNVPARAVQALLADRSRAADFDAKYGKGAAKKLLDVYGAK